MNIKKSSNRSKTSSTKRKGFTTTTTTKKVRLTPKRHDKNMAAKIKKTTKTNTIDYKSKPTKKKTSYKSTRSKGGRAK